MTNEQVEKLLRSALREDAPLTPPDLAPVLQRRTQRRRTVRYLSGALAACLVLGVGTAAYFRWFGGASKAAPQSAEPMLMTAYSAASAEAPVETPTVTETTMGDDIAEDVTVVPANSLPVPAAAPKVPVAPVPQTTAAEAEPVPMPAPAEPMPEAAAPEPAKSAGSGIQYVNGAQATPPSEARKALTAALPETETWNAPAYELLSESARWQVWRVSADGQTRTAAFDLVTGTAYTLNGLMPWISRSLQDEELYIGGDETLYILRDGEWAASGSLADGAPVKETK